MFSVGKESDKGYVNILCSLGLFNNINNHIALGLEKLEVIEYCNIFKIVEIQYYIIDVI